MRNYLLLLFFGGYLCVKTVKQRGKRISDIKSEKCNITDEFLSAVCRLKQHYALS